MRRAITTAAAAAVTAVLASGCGNGAGGSGQNEHDQKTRAIESLRQCVDQCREIRSRLRKEMAFADFNARRSDGNEARPNLTCSVDLDQRAVLKCES